MEVVVGKLRTALEVVTCLVLVVTSSIMLWTRFRNTSTESVEPPRPTFAAGTQIGTAGRAMEGLATAPVVLIEFSDFECSYCQKFTRDALPMIRREYIETGKIRLVFRHLPIAKIHPTAMAAAIYSECARASEKFWAVHDAIFGRPTVSLDQKTVDSSLSAVGLSTAKCDSQRAVFKKSIDDDMAVASAARVIATPSFLIGESKDGDLVNVVTFIEGAKSIGTFRKELDEELRRANESR